MNFIGKIWKVIRDLFESFFAPPFKTKQVSELPADLNRRTVYVVGENEHIWFVAMACPCGCKAILNMSLLQEDSPSWKLTVHSDQTASLSPSIWRKIGCRSHFFLKHGRVEMVLDNASFG